MKKKISLAFTLLVALIVLTFPSIRTTLLSFNMIRLGVHGALTYLINLFDVLLPVILVVLLILNQKKPMGRAAGVVCLIGGGCELFFAAKLAINLVRTLPSLRDIYTVVMGPNLIALVTELFIGICMIKVGLHLFTGVKLKGLKPLIIVGAFLIFFLGLLRTVGHHSITEALPALVTLTMLWHLAPACNDREKCVATNLKSIIIIAIVVALLLFIPEMLNGNLGSSNTSSSGSSRTCRSCGRKFTDSSNKSSIARTNMCTNCYNNFKWASSAVGK